MSIAKRVGLALLAVGIAAAVPAQAHHSSLSAYFIDKKVDIEGTVVQFQFQSPHSFVQVMAPDKDGVMQRWAVEWGAGGLLAADNISSGTLRPGDKVKITGNPARNAGDHRLRMSSIERTTDHWKWSGALG